MRYTEGNAAELKEMFWKALAHSPYVMLQLEGEPASAVPMTAQLDRDAHSAIWFFTRRSNRFAALGPASFTFTGTGHDLFARVHGTLAQETSRERLDRQWSNWVEAWFPGGKDDPELLMLRMELGDAEIWSGQVGVINMARMALGIDVTDKVEGQHTETRL